MGSILHIPLLFSSPHPSSYLFISISVGIKQQRYEEAQNNLFGTISILKLKVDLYKPYVIRLYNS